MEERKVEEKKKEKRIAVIFGGCSPEYGVSLESAYSVICHLDRERYQPVPVGISRTGSWFYFTGETEKIKEDTWCNEADCIPALLSPDRGRKGLWLLQTEPVLLPIDATFPVLHGKNGEDGTVQGLIELAGLPLIGCGVLASALCMDKDRAHRLAQLAGVRVPKAMVLERTCWDGTAGQSHIDRQGSTERQNHMERQGSIERQGSMERQDSIDKQDSIRRLQEFTAELGYPLYVKPVKAGSSFGVTKVLQPDKLEEAIDQAFAYDSQVIIEENIEGFEVGCAVLGREDLIVGEVDEIELQEGFFDFTEKYTLQTAAIHVPARISAGKAEEIKEAAKRIYRALDCSGFARVDLFLTPEGDIVFNEVNTIPGFTEHSRYPGMMKAAGYSMEELLELLCGEGGRP